MQLKTLHPGNKCSWCDCSELMRFRLIVIEFIYMIFISPFNHWHIESHGKAYTPIELMQRSLLHRLIASDSTRLVRSMARQQAAAVLADFAAFPDKAGIDLRGQTGIMHVTQLSWAETQRLSSSHTLAGPQFQLHRFPITVSLWLPFQAHLSWCMAQMLLLCVTQVKASAEQKRSRGPIWWLLCRTAAFFSSSCFKEHLILLCCTKNT